MSEVFVVVEGPTEQRFVEGVLAPWIAQYGVYMHASRVGKPGHKGGNRFAVARRDILMYLKQRSDTFVSCMFDFYGMGVDWPGREEANSKDHATKPITVEEAIHADIMTEFPDADDRFVPYVQMHEFEALLFTYPQSLAIALGDREADDDFQRVRDSFSTPEHINDNPQTAPSKRIMRIFESYDRKYRKTLHGTIAAKAITVDQMCDECPHFSSWIEALVREEE